MKHKVYGAALMIAVVGGLPANALATDIDHVARCLLKNKTPDGDASKSKALCFTEVEFHKVSVAETFLLLASVFCPGGESASAKQSDIFNEAAQREMGLGGTDQKQFAADQTQGRKLAHEVLDEHDKATIPRFCAEVKELYGPKGTEFSGLYSMVGAHIDP